MGSVTLRPAVPKGCSPNETDPDGESVGGGEELDRGARIRQELGGAGHDRALHWRGAALSRGIASRLIPFSASATGNSKNRRLPRITQCDARSSPMPPSSRLLHLLHRLQMWVRTDPPI